MLKRRLPIEAAFFVEPFTMSNWYYSKDNQQHGPVSAEELKAKLGKELPIDTLVWKEGMVNWAPARGITELNFTPQEVVTPAPQHQPEHAGERVSNDQPVDPYQAPSSVGIAMPSETSMEAIPEPRLPLSLEYCFSRAWELAKANLGMLFVAGLIYYFLGAMVGGVLEEVGEGIDGPVVNEEMPVFSYDEDGEIIFEEDSRSESEIYWDAFSESFMDSSGFNLDRPATLITNAIGSVFAMFLSLGIIAFGFALIRGEGANLGLIFSQGKATLKAFLASLIYYVIVVIGLVLLIVPGIYMASRLIFFEEAIVDKGLGPIEALKYSFKLTETNTLSIVCLVILEVIVVLAGVIAILIGLLWAIPVAYLARLIAYRYLHVGERAVIDPYQMALNGGQQTYYSGSQAY